jgi:3-dehydroquinate synthase
MDVSESEQGYRKSLMINLGGGMVTDLGGFAASTFNAAWTTSMVPTTLLGLSMRLWRQDGHQLQRT